MIQEAIAKVQDLAVVAASLQQLTLSGDKAGVSYTYNRLTKELKRMETEVAGRAYKAGSLGEMAAMVKHWVGVENEETGDDPAKAVVFVDGDGITAVLNEQDRRDERIVMKFAVSEAFANLRGLESTVRTFNQREFIWLLRTTFKDMVSEPFDLLGLVRVVKFKSDSAGESTMRTGKESISREAMASVMTEAGAGFPEEATLKVPVYTDLVDEAGEVCELEIDCAMDVRVDKQEFVLKPIPGETDRARRLTLAWVQSVLQRLLGDAAEVFVGSVG